MPPPEDEAQTPAPTEDTATQDAASTEETPATEQGSEPAVDFEKRYNDLRPEFDRNQQRLSNYEQLVDHLQDPEHQAEALEALGLQLADEEDDEYDWDDENDPDERVDRIESYLEQEAELRAMAAQEDAMLDAVEDRVEALQKEHGDFSDEELETIFGIAEANPDDDGIPDVKYAYELLTKVSDARREKYLESKKGTKPPVGQAAGDNVDLDDEDGRVKALADMLEAEEATTT